jgi:hypothetical protein
MSHEEHSILNRATYMPKSGRCAAASLVNSASGPFEYLARTTRGQPSKVQAVHPAVMTPPTLSNSDSVSDVLSATMHEGLDSPKKRFGNCGVKSIPQKNLGYGHEDELALKLSWLPYSLQTKLALFIDQCTLHRIHKYFSANIF